MMKPIFAILSSIVIGGTVALNITDIQGLAFLSPFNGQTVQDVQGVVTAKGPSGFWMQGPASTDERVSNGISVFTSSKTILAQVALGDLITLSGKVNEFHSNKAVLSVTEIGFPTNITVLSTNNTVKPLILGADRSLPTSKVSALDTGDDGFLSLPNNASQMETVNATLQPHKFGIDFWESLEGQLVTVPNPVAIDFENSFGEIWVYGDWHVTGKNKRGGLTLNTGKDGLPDLNPETVIIGAPLDGSHNPSVAIGTQLSTITGVIQYQFGFYYVLPLVAPVVLERLNSTAEPTKLKPVKNSCVVTIGDYNVDNFAANDTTHVTGIATHIVEFLRNPDLLHIQEIQDNSGPTDDGTVSANATLQALVDAINATSGGVEYSFVDIDPINNQDGGEPGGNIRQVYLYRPEKIALAGGSPVGGSLDATAVQVGSDGRLGLTFNPGRIDPNNTAWLNSRKSLAAVWERVGGSGERLFTVNVHHTAKDGGSSEQGNLRPPVNEGVDQRTAQVQVVADFVKTILTQDSKANVVAAGDFNEFLQTKPVFAAFDDVLSDIDEAVGIHPLERYTFVFNMNLEQLDHIFISDAILGRNPEAEHIHVNQWAPSFSARSSDHDPTVARIRLC